MGADSLRANPMRTVLATTGAIIGVASLVAAFAITDGVDVWSRELIARESSVQDVAITPRVREQVRGRSMPVRGYPVLTTADGDRAAAEVPGVMRHTMMLNGRSEAEYLDARAPMMMTLCTAGFAEFAGLELSGGRFFTAMEARRGAPVIVLGHRTAAELAGMHDPLWLIGRSIRAGGEVREVLGVLAPPPSGDEPDMVAFAPLRGGEALLEPTSAVRVPTLRLKARSIEAVDSLRVETVNWLAERYGTGIDQLDVVVGTERLENTKQAMLLSKLLLGLLASLILAVGGIGIMNVLLAAVVERTREIGSRKAVGARSSDIQAQFLVESVTVTTVGSALGFVGGLVIAFVGTAVFRQVTGAGIYPVVHLSTSLLAVGAAVVVGLAFGTYPARRAARLSPVDAIAREYRLRVRADDLDLRDPVPPIAHVHQPGPAAHLAILDVLLVAATARVERDFVGFPAIRALDERLRLGGAVAERKLLLDLVLRPVVIAPEVRHPGKVAHGGGWDRVVLPK